MNDLRLAEILRQFAKEAPTIQIEAQRTSAGMFEQIKSRLMSPPDPVPAEQAEAIAKACTPFFQVPAMKASVGLEMSYATKTGFFFMSRTKREATTVQIEMEMVAAPLSPAAAFPRALPPALTALPNLDPVNDDELLHCKQRMAGTAPHLVEGVRSFLLESSDWYSSQTERNKQYKAMGKSVDKKEFEENYRLAMRAILRRMLLVPTEGGLLRRLIEQWQRPNGLFLDYLEALKMLEDHANSGGS